MDDDGFEWRISDAGYRWTAWKPSERGVGRRRLRAATAAALQRKGALVRVTYPGRDPRLFEAFAGLEPSLDDVNAFADRHGHLGISPGKAEPFARWCTEINRMRRVVELLAAARRRRPHVSELHALLGKSATPGLALAEAAQIIDGALAHRRFAPRLRYDAATGKATSALEPDSLLGLLWLQAREAFVHAETGRDCIACGKRILAGGGIARAHRRYCGPACQMKAYRRRIRSTPNRRKR